ncbi:MAG: hypothetical protein ACREBG_05470 [Pyrinomonadaceae bacterium]
MTKSLAAEAELLFAIAYFRPAPAEQAAATRFFIHPPENAYFDDICRLPGRAARDLARQGDGCL